MSDLSTSRAVPGWVRIGLVALGLPNLAAGAWAVLAPHSWYDRFPGWDPRLVAAEPPYNAHLASDAGAGLLAAGLVVLVAAWLADTRSVRLAIVAFAAFAVPHAAFHVANPSELLTSAQDAQNAVTLVVSVLAAAVLFTAARPSPAGPARLRDVEVAA